MKIVVFSCNWDGWSCFENASNNGLSYSTDVKVVRVSCLSRLHAGLILKAFEYGADGVMLVGCQPGNCHFNNDSIYIEKECSKVSSLMTLMGIDTGRLKLTRLPAFDGTRLLDEIRQFMDEIGETSIEEEEEPATDTCEA